MQHSWVNDAPSGTYKNNKLSAEIRLAAIKQAKFVPFAKPEMGYGKKKGESVTITRMSNVTVPTSDILNELDYIPQDSVSISTQSVVVYERGRAIPYTSLASDLAGFDLEMAVQRKLKDQLSLSMDRAAATAMKSGQILAIPTGASATTFETDGAVSTSATVNMSMYQVESIRDYMFSTLAIAPYEGDDYVCILSTQAKRGIIRDSNWVTWQQYTQPEKKFNGEIGRIENIRFIETNHTDALAENKGTGSVLGEAVFFGADPMVMAVVQDPELRAKESDDYGRKKGVAWYGVYGFAQVWRDSANSGEARVVYVTST